jgi:hypothetical protein
MSVLGELDHTGMLWQSSKANPILSQTTDCIQSTDYLHSNQICSLIWTALAQSSSHADPEAQFSLILYDATKIAH